MGVKVTDSHEVEKMSARVDWLTITGKSPSIRKKMHAKFVGQRHKLEREGETTKPWPMMGYQGYLCGGIRWGSRPDSSIVMLSGDDAALLWRRFALHADNCSRVDLAVTVTIKYPFPELITLYYNWFTRNGGVQGHPGLSLTRIENTNGGQTLYVGSRKSDQMGRIYDKAAEEGIDELVGRVWRYEVEYKNRRAQTVLKSLLDASGSTLPGVIQCTVHRWFDDREFPPLWVDKGAVLASDIEARVTSDDVSLAWITTQVAPTVDRLVKRDKLASVIKALGLTTYVTPVDVELVGFPVD